MLRRTLAVIAVWAVTTVGILACCGGLYYMFFKEVQP